ncbi:MAG: AbrB/MazE/SpoVT family DNA-binding domain-containing protein [Nanoarchaeota archaeon]|nr:AbrB/MazE/SpoVT family DNA-binding domain-containing protein [Nanoarchaeota archaeon]
MIVNVSSKGQIVLPKSLREELGINTGDHLAVTGTKEGIVLSKLQEFEALCERLRKGAAPIIKKNGWTEDDVVDIIHQMRKEDRARH